jgi:hypothetical protein
VDQAKSCSHSYAGPKVASALHAANKNKGKKAQEWHRQKAESRGVEEA